jgi:hypothetical protein
MSAEQKADQWDKSPLQIQTIAKEATKTGNGHQKFYVSDEKNKQNLCVIPLHPSALLGIDKELLLTYRKFCSLLNEQMKRIDSDPSLLEFTKCMNCRADLDEEKKQKYMADRAYGLCSDCDLKWWSCSDEDEVDAMVAKHAKTLNTYFFSHHKLQTFWLIEDVLLVKNREYMGVVQFSYKNSGWVTICLELFFSKTGFSMSALHECDIKGNQKDEEKFRNAINAALFPTFDKDQLRAGIIEHYDYERIRRVFEDAVKSLDNKEIYMDLPRRYALQKILDLIGSKLSPNLFLKLQTILIRSPSPIVIEACDVDLISKIMKTRAVVPSDQLLHFFYPTYVVLPQMGGQLSQLAK